MLKYLVIMAALALGCTTIEDIDSTKRDTKDTVEEKSACVCPGQEEERQEEGNEKEEKPTGQHTSVVEPPSTSSTIVTLTNVFAIVVLCIMACFIVVLD